VNSFAPTSEEVHVRGFGPFLSESTKINFSLEPISGYLSQWKRNNKIVQFGFRSLEWKWNSTRRFLYWDEEDHAFVTEPIHPEEQPSYTDVPNFNFHFDFDEHGASQQHFPTMNTSAQKDWNPLDSNNDWGPNAAQQATWGPPVRQAQNGDWNQLKNEPPPAGFESDSEDYDTILFQPT